uniref:non-specific serine/threonine protein kinase n=1 Tax=Parastrongyloides trichosuri TaxID=131310 RepID=A0A0N4ZEP9_PARTI
MAPELKGVNLKKGTNINRFVITEKISEGSYGSVYVCKEKGTGKEAALKAEMLSNSGNCLKLEVQILKRLKGKRHVAQFISCGKCGNFCYMIMTLLGKSLSYYIYNCKLQFTMPTILRIILQSLYALKQIHESGFIHRDMKPANMTVGRGGIDKRIIHIIDFGLAREFVILDNGRLRLRKPRDRCLFRGTIKYCSINALENAEQGRGDDLVSLFYICSEFSNQLPWSSATTKTQVLQIKKEVPDKELYPSDCETLGEILSYVKGIRYNQRPDYFYIYAKLKEELDQWGCMYSDPYDWELYECDNRSIVKKPRKKHKKLIQRGDESNSIQSVTNSGTTSTTSSLINSSAKTSSGKSVDGVTINDKILEYSNEFFEEHLSSKYFKNNELGF